MIDLGSAAVIGLGLIGGSVARDLHARGLAVRGWDSDPAALQAAVRDGVVEPLPAALAGLREVDLVVLAVPVRSTLELLGPLAERVSDRTVVMDVGSTKRSAVSEAVRAGIGTRFVGSHPLAGDTRSGWDASRTGLFEGERIFITPTHQTEERAADLVSRMWQAFGARPQRIDPYEHDRLMAWISHAPQALSTVLGLALSDAGIAPSDLGSGGRGAIRLAASSSGMWADILADNSEEVARALHSILSRLGSLTAAVERGDVTELERLLRTSRSWATTET